jgi:hypothetical protein
LPIPCPFRCNTVVVVVLEGRNGWKEGMEVSKEGRKLRGRKEGRKEG